MFSVIDRSLNLDMLKPVEAHLHTYSSIGLRTLVIGMRKLSSSEFEEWQSAYKSASTALMGRAAMLRRVANDVEHHLTILGASGIEDKLQQGVLEAIECLRIAGANDISMIQMADVGIGISGQGGRHAVMASDFAMGQFRFLVHRHWNYQLMTYMILYNFYRNAVFVLLLFRYVLFTSFTLTSAIINWSSVLYLVIYTSIPTIIVGVLDKNLSRTSLLKHPQLYGAGQRQKASWLSLHRTALPLSNYYSSIKINQLDMIDARGYNRSKISSRAIEAYLIQVMKSLVDLGALQPTGDMSSVRRSVKFFLEKLLNERLTQQQTLSAISEDAGVHALSNACHVDVERISKRKVGEEVNLRRANNTEIMLTKVKMPLPDMVFIAMPQILVEFGVVFESPCASTRQQLPNRLFFLVTGHPSRPANINDIWQGIEFSQSKPQGLTGIMFSDVARIEEAVEELQELVRYSKNPELFVKMGIKPPHGVILEVPPGCGKTLVAKAIAGVPFYQMAGSEFV
ncbi:hypothetical protein ACS0TY_009405 [Phlomoides rotata]